MLPEIVQGGGLIDLSSAAPVIQWGWFLVTIPNLIWYLIMFGLLIIGIFVELPTKRVRDTDAASDRAGSSKEA